MPETTPPPEKTHPLHLIHDAMAYCRARGIRVQIGVTNHGIHCVSAHASRRWERDPYQEAVDPLGAAVLAAQPPTMEIAEAVAQALGVSIPFTEGMADGMEKLPPNGSWLRSKARVLYAQGFQAGTDLRALLLGPRRKPAVPPPCYVPAPCCPKHTTTPLQAGVCPLCEELAITAIERGQA